MAALDRGVDDSTVYPIIEQLSAHIGAEPTELPPLGNAVDPDALARLLDHSGPEPVRVRFTYWGYDVTVDSDGGVVVSER